MSTTNPPRNDLPIWVMAIPVIALALLAFDIIIN